MVWCSRMLGLLSGMLAVATAVALPLTALSISGRGDLSLETRLEPPYALDLDYDPQAQLPDDPATGRSIYVDGDHITAYLNFPIGRESEELSDPPSIRTTVHVGRDDRDTRAVFAGVVITWLVLAWIGLENLRRLVRSAREGHPFDARNVRRLRWAAGAVIAFPIVSRIFLEIADGTLDSTLRVSTAPLSGATSWTLVAVGVGLLALAEVFRVGTELSELEQSTV